MKPDPKQQPRSPGLARANRILEQARSQLGRVLVDALANSLEVLGERLSADKPLALPDPGKVADQPRHRLRRMLQSDRGFGARERPLETESPRDRTLETQSPRDRTLETDTDLARDAAPLNQAIGADAPTPPPYPSDPEPATSLESAIETASSAHASWSQNAALEAPATLPPEPELSLHGANAEPTQSSGTESEARSFPANDPAQPSVTASEARSFPANDPAQPSVTDSEARPFPANDPAQPSVAAAYVAQPAPEPPTRGEHVVCDEPIRTRSMARLLASQGHHQRALSIYALLLAANGSDATLQAEAAALRNLPDAAL
jgi:hypothetical protein